MGLARCMIMALGCQVICTLYSDMVDPESFLVTYTYENQKVIDGSDLKDTNTFTIRLYGKTWHTFTSN